MNRQISNWVIGICLGFGIWLLGFPSYGSTWLDPSLKWRTIETPHFSIHYYDRTEAQAKRMVDIAEEVHSRLAPILKHAPDLKTNVVLLDITDYSNGYTTVIPNPTVTLYMADIGSNLRPAAYETWLKYVFLHEYTHVLHLDTVEGSGKLFKLLFGRVSFPNGVMPTFMIEGMATYFETRHGYGGGRGDDPRWEAMMRMDVLEDNLKTLDQAAVDTVKWPGGSLRYLYGVFFLQYLSDQYGEDKIIRMSQEYGDYFFAGEGMDVLCQRVYGKSLPSLWNEWIDHMKTKYAEEKKRMGKEGLTRFRQLTDRGYYILKPKWSPDSQYIYYSQNNQDEYPSIRRIEPDGGRDEKMIEGIVLDDSMSIANGTLYFSKGDIVRNYYTYKDLYTFDLNNGRVKKLTEGLRAADPAVSMDGRTLVYVKDDGGKRTLWSLNPGSMQTSMIGKDEPDVQYLSPAFSPDGSKLAVAKWTLGGHQDIYLIDLKTLKEQRLISYGLSANPCFSPDGKFVIFDADGSGVCDLYACAIGTGKLYKITNVLGAAMMPDVSPDGKRIACINYSSRGHDLAVMDYDPAKWREVLNPSEAKNEKIAKEQTNELTGVISASRENFKPATIETETHDYNPWPSFFPKFWLPYSFSDENGTHMLIYTGGVDALSQHYAEVQFGYDWAVNRSSYSILYANNQFQPQLMVGLYDAVAPYSWDNGSNIYWERERGGALSCSFIGNRVFHEYDRQIFTVGYIYENLSNASSLEILSQQPSLGDIRGAMVGWSYSSARQYGYSVAPEDGIDLTFQGRFFSKELGSDYVFNNYAVTANKYIGLPAHNTIALKSWASYIRGEQIVQQGYTWNSLGVRGYPGASFTGTKMLKASIEYNLPISYIESGWGYGLTFFDRLWATLFFEGGSATYGKLDSAPVYRSWGGEISLNTVNLYGYIPFTLKVGYAMGIDTGGGGQIYFSVGM